MQYQEKKEIKSAITEWGILGLVKKMKDSSKEEQEKYKSWLQKK